MGSWRGVRPVDLAAVPQETAGAGIRDAEHPREGKGRSPGPAHSGAGGSWRSWVPRCGGQGWFWGR